MNIFQKIKDSVIFRCFISTTVGSGISKILLVLAVFCCANIMTKDDFGLFCFVRDILNGFLCMCALNYIGLCTKFTAEISYTKASEKKLLILAIFLFVVCFFSGGILLFLPDYLMSSILGGNELIIYFRIIGLLLPLFVLQPIIEGILRGKMYFKLVAGLQIFSSIIFIVLLLTGFYFFAVNGVIYGLLLYYLIYSILSLSILAYLFPLWRKIKKAFVGIKLELGVLNKMIIPVFFLSFSEIPIMWWAKVLVVKYDSMAGIAIITVIIQIRNMITLIPSYFFTTYTTFASKLNAEKNYKKYFDVMLRGTYLILSVSVCVVVLLIMLDKTVLGLFGDNYKNDNYSYMIGMFVLPFYMAVSLLRVNLLVMEHQKVMLFISIFSNIIFILLLYIGIYFDMYMVDLYFYSLLIQQVIVFIVMFKITQYDKKRLLVMQNSNI